MNDRVFRASNAHKLEDPDRRVWLPPDEVIAGLELGLDSTVADIGAGTGYFAIPLADLPATAHVFAVDLQAEMLELLKRKLTEANAGKISLLQGAATALPLESGSCDLALLANIWHEIDDRKAALSECRRILRNGGRIAILDWRTDVEQTPVEQTPGPPLEHRLSQETVRGELESEGWRVVRACLVGEYSYLVVAAPIQPDRSTRSI